MGDIGIVAQRYTLVLYGNSQDLKIEPWEPEIQRTVEKKYEWKADTWYHLKLRVENMPDGKVRARQRRSATRGRAAALFRGTLDDLPALSTPERAR